MHLTRPPGKVPANVTLRWPNASTTSQSPTYDMASNFGRPVLISRTTLLSMRISRHATSVRLGRPSFLCGWLAVQPDYPIHAVNRWQNLFWAVYGRAGSVLHPTARPNVLPNIETIEISIPWGRQGVQRPDRPTQSISQVVQSRQTRGFILDVNTARLGLVHTSRQCAVNKTRSWRPRR